MKAIQISRTGGSDVLDLVDLPTPKPGAGEVLVKAGAIGVNYFDTMIRTGRYRWMPKLPFVLGNEMSGHVEAVGDGVRSLRVGQPVFIAGYEIGNRGSLYAEYAAVPEEAAWPLPASVDLDAATDADQLPARGNPAAPCRARHRADDRRGLWRGRRRRHRADRPRQARRCRRDRGRRSAHEVRVREARGADHTIDHRAEPLVERVLSITGGRGADIVFDHIAGKAFTDGLKMTAPLGMIVSYAVLGGMPETDLFKEMRANIERSPAVRCFTMHTYDHMPEPRRAAMKRAVDLLAAARFGPRSRHVCRSPMRRAPTTLSKPAQATGKIVLKP